MLPSMLKKKLKATASAMPSSKSGGGAKRPTKPKPKTTRKPLNTTAIGKKTKTDHFKALTTDELNRLRGDANEDLTNETLFAIQIDEILKAAQPNEKYRALSDDWIDKLAQHLVTCVPSDAEKRTDHKWMRSVQLPLDDDDTAQHQATVEFQFIAPKQMHRIGSSCTDTMLGPQFQFDVAVEMPASTFQKSDYLNMLYHRKKALYLARIAVALSAWSSEVASCEFSFFHADRFNPVVRIQPVGKMLRHISVVLHVSCESNAFKLSRFLPSTSNVRAKLFGGTGADILTATPHYNSSVLRDMTLFQNEEFIRKSLATAPNVRGALVLFKLWLRTRGLNVGAFVVTAFATWLLRQRKINLSMTVYEVLRNLWMHFGLSRWEEEGKGISLNPAQTDLSPFHQHFDMVFVDVTGSLNLCHDLFTDDYLRVRDESTKALAYLTTASVSNFRYLFTNQMPAQLQFDHLIVFKDDAKFRKMIKSKVPQKMVLDYCGNRFPAAVHMLTNCLQKGLGRRVASMTVLTDDRRRRCDQRWPISGSCPPVSLRLSIGLILNAEFACEIVDKGPQADDPTAEQFKAFWGDKSELRRFTDGTITEACVWAAPKDALAKKRLISKDICLHLLRYHFGLQAADGTIDYVANEFDVAYQLDSSNFLFEDVDDNSENMAAAVIRSFDEVAKHLRALDGVPLDVASVLGTSPVFRYCEVQPILKQANEVMDGDIQILQAYKVNEGVIQFSANGKWPDSVVVMEQIKAAFYLRFAQGLQKQFNLPARGSADCVEVIKDGYLYRLRIALPKELQLRRQYKTPKGVLSHRDTPESLQMEKSLMLLPKLTVALHTLYHTHTSFGPAVLIAKRWLHSQLLDTHLWPEECTELLLAHIYMQPNSFATPTQPQTAFFRFLHLMSSVDWHQDMIVVNFNETLSTDTIKSIETRFVNDRDSFPALCIVTSCEAQGTPATASIWTRAAPAPEIVARVGVLARHALQLVLDDVSSPQRSLEAKSLFFASLDGYDVVITLRRTHVQACTVHDFAKNTKRKKLMDKSVPAVDFNLAQFLLRDLRAAYDSFAIFFHDPCGGEQIAVLWRPSALAGRDRFQMDSIYAHRSAAATAADSSNLYQCNFEQIIEDFRVIGRDLVEKIDVKK